MKGTFFQDVNEIQAMVTKHLNLIPIDKYAPSFESLYCHFNDCITRGGDYVEA